MPLLFPPRFAPGPDDPDAFVSSPPPREQGPAGVLLVNLGTPDHPTPAAIRRYLAEFLSDPRVIELPDVFWQPILRGLVLTRRPAKLAPRYRDIWMKEGSPLLVYSAALADRVQDVFDGMGLNVRVALGMRYGNPTLGSAIEELRRQGCDRVLMVPMYPQYAASTTATAIDAVARHMAGLRQQPELRFIKRFHAAPSYIDNLARVARDAWENGDPPERLLLSFHGLPRVSVERGDPYHRDCMETARLLAEALDAPPDMVQVSFQSRFGAQRWLEPYTEPLLRSWAREGIRKVDVMCPGFLADCLETLEEIDMQCREAFMAEGGRQFRYLPCLNADPAWARAYAEIIAQHLEGWPLQKEE